MVLITEALVLMFVGKMLANSFPENPLG